MASALAGRVDGRPRWFLARQPVLRAMRMALAGPAQAQEPDERIADMLAGIDPETAAMMLVHLAADALRGQQPEGEARFGGTSENLAIELACNQIFNEPHDVGGMVSRTWALWNRHAAGLRRAKLDKPAADLLKDATGLELAELLALGFACWAMTTHDRVNGPVRINPFTLVKLPRTRSSASWHCSPPLLRNSRRTWRRASCRGRCSRSRPARSCASATK